MSRDLDTAHLADPSLESRSLDIVELLVSPVSRYEGRPADGAAPTPADELVDRIELRAGLGVVGDRYFNRPAHRRGSITLQGAEGLAAAASELGAPAIGLAQTRRNVLTRGLDLAALIGHDLELDSGEGPVVVRLHRAAPPCAWMDAAIAPGAHAALRGRGGVRAEPLTDGALAVGSARVRVLPPGGAANR